MSSRGWVVASECRLRIETERDAFDAIERSGKAARLLLTEDDLSAAFFDLRTGLAGAVLQKLATYGVLTAIVVEDPARYGPRFAELAREHARHPQVRITSSRTDAEAWLGA
jgi:hypothetical protein